MRLLQLFLVLPWLLVPADPARAQRAFPPVDFTIAFLGDQGLGPDPQAVLQLCLAEGADAVVHLGDFDYADDPAAWEAQVDGILGPDFPYFATVGNHEVDTFSAPGGYQERLAARMNRLGVAWVGNLGIESSFRYRGIFITFTAPAIYPVGPGPDPVSGDGIYDVFIRDQLAATDAIWRISSWHKNMHAMQTGNKPDETGWGVYEASRRGGAIVATAHEHAYSRTHLMSRFDTQAVASTAQPLVLAMDDPATVGVDEGRSFAFVSGLGGRSIRDQETTGPWWAAVYTEDQGANFGALFGVFNHQGNPRRAYFYFKDIDGVVADAFSVESPLGTSPRCSDGVDNDGDGRVDFDGGVLGGASEITEPDPQCAGAAWRDREAATPAPAGCGIGPELVLLVGPLGWLAGRRRQDAGGSTQIGDDQARSRIVAGTNGSGSRPRRSAS